MHLDAEVLFDRAETLQRRQRGVLGLEFGDEGDHLGGDLVTAPGAPLARQKAGKAGGLQGGLGLVVGRSGDAEGCGDIADGDTVGLMAPHHLVAHLDQVSGVEERIGDEQRVADSFGMGIERAVLRQRFALGIAPFCPCHVRLHRFVNINMPLLLACQMLCRRYMQHYCRYNRSHAQDALRAAASFSLRMRHNCLYASFGPRHAPSRSSNSHRVIKSIVRNAALPPAIRRNSSAGARSVNAVEIVRSRASSPA